MPPTPPAIAAVRFEHHRETLGIGEDAPRLSWTLAGDTTGWHQVAYDIEATLADGTARGSTGRVESGDSVLVAWPFAPLASRERVLVRVRAWSDDGRATNWSNFYTVEAGLLQPEDWAARFVTPDWDEDTTRPGAAPLLRREFAVRAGVTQARLYITALGVYEAQLNGAVVGDHVLAPGWTSYSHRLRYQTFDVTDTLQEGQNALGATLGDGWYRGRLGFGGGRRNQYGTRLALLAQLEIDYADGTSERIATDDGWRATTGPILASDIYGGETYDARLERPGWSAPGYNDGEWFPVCQLERDFATLVAPSGPPVRRIELIEPVAVTTSPSGRTLVDFGQNLVGWVRLSVHGPAGTAITLRHAEVLEHGELGTRPLRLAEATDHYTLRGSGIETWEPRFTFHGFRYIEVTGWPGELHREALRAVVSHSDMERTGWFECSDPLVNKLHQNVVWGMRGNFLDVPTDCPQRDERLGWTGDIQVFAPTATFLYDCAGFLRSWLRDLAAEQLAAGGVVPVVVPNVLGPPFPAAAWGDAAAVVPWVLYGRYGDARILEIQFESMRAWVDAVARLAGDSLLWDQGFQFGDWLDPAAPPDKPGNARADRHLVATAYFARSAEIVSLAAGVLDKHEEQARYGELASAIRAAFGREYVTPAGRMLSDATTAYALALEWSLLPDVNQRQRAAERLLDLVRAEGFHISTGFVGTPLICDALSNSGAQRAAYRLLLQRECPSWLYPVTMGATTVWERWDSMLPDGSINPGEMTSFNHYALGAVADWLHRVVAGLASAEPGYRRLEVRPRPGGGLTSAKATHTTPYGTAECAWQIEGEELELTLVVPPNSSASVALPGSDETPFDVGPGTHRWRYRYQTPDARSLTVDDSVGEFLDDERAWELVVQELNRAAPGNPFIVGMLRTLSRASLRQALGGVPQAASAIDAIEAALARE